MVVGIDCCFLILIVNLLPPTHTCDYCTWEASKQLVWQACTKHIQAIEWSSNYHPRAQDPASASVCSGTFLEDLQSGRTKANSAAEGEAIQTPGTLNGSQYTVKWRQHGPIRSTNTPTCV